MTNPTPVAWSLETDRFYFLAEKHGADISMSHPLDGGTVWFNTPQFEAFCRDLSCTEAQLNQARADTLHKVRERLYLKRKFGVSGEFWVEAELRCMAAEYEGEKK